MTDGRLKVAIIDDDVSVRVALARLLRASAFEPSVFNSVREFVGALKTQKPDCIVVDLHMPEVTGLDLLRYLQREGSDVPAIVITAFDDPDVRRQSANYGAKAFLTKPPDGAALVSAIRAATVPT